MSPVQQFRLSVIAGLKTLREKAGTNPEREIDRAIDLVTNLPAPMAPRKCTDEEIANGTCQP